jgi:23S rRNA (cytosine1962-C5)-methyltransferase
MLRPVPIEVSGTAIVTRRGLRRARRGWPWLTHEDIVRYDGDGGPFVDLVDDTSLPMGTALYDPRGRAPIRLLSSARTRDPVSLIHTRLERALARRHVDLDTSESGRLCHGEADGVPGLFVDRFGPGLLVTIACEPMGRVVDELMSLLEERTQVDVVAVARGDEVSLLRGAGSRVRFLHGRLELSVDLALPGAQKVTADLERQRALRRWARGRCLDLEAGLCGYGLQLADAGAAEVTVVDEPPNLSTSVLDDARHNGVIAPIERIERDAVAWLRGEEEAKRRYDVVVYHPRPSEEEAKLAHGRAIEHATACLRHLDEGGILASSSGSLNLDDDAFTSALQEAAAKSRKRLQVLARLGPGPDHPTLAGTRYLPSLVVARVLSTA